MKEFIIEQINQLKEEYESGQISFYTCWNEIQNILSNYKEIIFTNGR